MSIVSRGRNEVSKTNSPGGPEFVGDEKFVLINDFFKRVLEHFGGSRVSVWDWLN